MKWILVIIFILCICASAFSSLTESAYSKNNELRLRKESSRGVKSAKRALKLANDYDGTISAILFANNLVNIAASSIATILGIYFLEKHLGKGTAATISSILTIIILLIFGEILPKVVGNKYSYTLAKILSGPLNVLRIITFPIVFVVTKLIKLLSPIWTERLRIDDEDAKVTEDELIEMVDTIEEEGFIDEKQGELIKSAIEFTETTAYEVMTPRVDVVGFDIEADISELMEENDIFTHSRIPVYKDSLDNVVGIINSIDILCAMMNNEKIVIQNIMDEPYNVHASKPISEILEDFKESHHHIAIVKDEFGGTAGIVTLEDIVEELVGEIWDEMDEVEEQVLPQEEGKYIIDGALNLEDFTELMNLDDDLESDYVTVGGWCIEQLGRFAENGDAFDYENLSVTILEATEFTVEKILVDVKPKEEED